MTLYVFVIIQSKTKEERIGWTTSYMFVIILIKLCVMCNVYTIFYWKALDPLIHVECAP